MDKRYEALYVHPDFCDGFWDNEKNFYLNDDELKNILYENLSNEEIEEILNRNIENIEENEIEEKKDMDFGDLKLVLEGLLLALMGLFTIFWYIIKLFSCVMIAGYISVRLGFDGWYWLFSSVIIFCVFIKILFYGNSTSTYNELYEKYKEKCDE